MNDFLVYGIGFFAQFLFSARLIIQWLTSEKNKKVTAPNIFWSLSLAASFLLLIYGYLRNDFAIMLGQFLTYYIYIRNLQIQKQWIKIHIVFRYIFILIPFILIAYTFNNNIFDLNNLFKNKDIPYWLLILGIISQIIFTFRFIYQWYYSEKNKKSSLPFGFWSLSIIGSLLILIYAIIRKDPVLFIGHIVGLVIYIRNVVLLKKTG